MENYLLVIKKEHTAEDNSFSLKLRNFEWDKKAFSELIIAMQLCCEDMEKEEFLPRWLAEFFYRNSHWVRDISIHENFLREYPDEYYEKAYRRLEDLATWFFNGRSPYMDGYGFEPL